VIDPGVRVAYEWEQAVQLAVEATSRSTSSGSGGSSGSSSEIESVLGPVLRWSDVAAAAEATSLAGDEWRARLDREECCNLQPGKTYVNFRRDCQPRDLLSGENFTALLFRTQAQHS
jgi:hypothetical protein